jgi:hypothetical protein
MAMSSTYQNDVNGVRALLLQHSQCYELHGVISRGLYSAIVLPHLLEQLNYFYHNRGLNWHCRTSETLEDSDTKGENTNVLNWH